MKGAKTKKSIFVAFVVMAFWSSPMGLFAQGGLFQRGVTDEVHYGYGGSTVRSGVFGYRSEKTGIIDNQTFGQTVPVGSGIAILLVIGAGYAALKRKEDEQ